VTSITTHFCAKLLCMSTRNRNWCFTENSEPRLLVTALEQEGLPAGIRYVVGQLEQGEHEHFQGYLYLDNACGLRWLQKNLSPTAHFEAARGSYEQNKAYCTKAETRVEGPFEWGEPPSQGKRTDLEEIKAKLDSGTPMKQIAQEHFASYLRYNRGFDRYKILTQAPRQGPVETWLFYGPTGCGKTRKAKEMFPDAYDKAVGPWWDGYDGQTEVLLDEHNTPWMRWDMLLRMLDPLGLPLMVETKGSTVQLRANKFIFTCNVPPEDWYKDERIRANQAALDRRITNRWEWTKRPQGGYYIIKTSAAEAFSRSEQPITEDSEKILN